MYPDSESFISIEQLPELLGPGIFNCSSNWDEC
jgi:hypothetical protein